MIAEEQRSWTNSTEAPVVGDLMNMREQADWNRKRPAILTDLVTAGRSRCGVAEVGRMWEIVVGKKSSPGSEVYIQRDLESEGHSRPCERWNAREFN